jgi:hypothetical protein
MGTACGLDRRDKECVHNSFRETSKLSTWRTAKEIEDKNNMEFSEINCEH